jgi:CHAD domain-containing protein
MRTFAAVLFRRIATKSRKDPVTNETRELFMTLQVAQKTAIRQRLLECLDTESISQVRNKISDAIAEIARQYTDEGMLESQLESLSRPQS